MKRITKDNVIYSMSSANDSVLSVDQDTLFCLETEDCYGGRLKSPDDKFTKDMWDTVNPATGPVYINRAVSGDIVMIKIEKIMIRDHAVMCIEHQAGALGEFIEGVETTIFPIKNNQLVFNSQLVIPVKPMIGVIGTAPAGPPILNETPGEHGGNMDCKLITADSTVYLPVNVDGALLALGDLHAVMGDGEVCICGAEVAGEVVLKVNVIPAVFPTPCVETKEYFHFIGSAVTLDECEQIVLAKAHRFLTDIADFSVNNAVRVMSLVGELGVCQVVDPLKTMRFSVPKFVLSKRKRFSGKEICFNVER